MRSADMERWRLVQIQSPMRTHTICPLITKTECGFHLKVTPGLLDVFLADEIGDFSFERCSAAKVCNSSSVQQGGCSDRRKMKAPVPLLFLIYTAVARSLKVVSKRGSGIEGIAYFTQEKKHKVFNHLLEYNLCVRPFPLCRVLNLHHCFLNWEHFVDIVGVLKY
ncbi:hypothetical protein AGIG_G4182 [Arapaima gigas]